MKKIIAALVMLALTVNPFAVWALSLEVNEDKEIRYVPPEFFGVANGWGDEVNKGVTIADLNGNISDKYTGMWEKYDITQWRKAGGYSNIFQWKSAIGPKNERQSQQMVKSYNYVIKEGLDEWIKGSLKINKDMSFVYAVNMDTDTPENAADLVEYLRGDGKTNYNGGINWAKIRIQNGIPDPVRVDIWELGNELDLIKENGVPTWSVDRYISESKKWISAIRSVDPDAKIAAHVYTNDFEAVGNEWHRTVLMELGNDIDYMVVHKYFAPGTAYKVCEPMLDRVIEDIKNITGEDRIKVVMTEFGSAYRDQEEFKSFEASIQLEEAIGFSDFYNRCLVKPEVVGTNAWSFNIGDTNGWTWVLLYMYNGEIKPMVMMDAMQIYHDYVSRNTIVDFKLEGFERQKASDTTCTVAKTEKGLNIVFSNLSNDSVSVDMNFIKNYKLTHKRVLTGTSLTAINYRERQECKAIDEDIYDDDIIKKFEVPKHSVTAITLEEVK